MSMSGFIRSTSCVILMFTAIAAASTKLRRKGYGAPAWIVGGSEANLRDYPFMVSLQFFHSSWDHSCGGYIVTSRIVLTACHCVITGKQPLTLRQPSYSRVVAGQGNLNVRSKQRELRGVSKFVPHPHCALMDKDVQWFRDVAAVILNRKLSYNSHIQPVKLFSKDPTKAKTELKRLQKDESICHSPGWGLSKTDPDILSPRLKVALKNLMTSEACEYTLCQKAFIFCVDYDKFDQVCAVGQNSSVCKGDSGGPLICNGFLFGSVSYGVECGPGTPSVYSSVVPILDFINSI